MAPKFFRRSDAQWWITKYNIKPSFFHSKPTPGMDKFFSDLSKPAKVQDKKTASTIDQNGTTEHEEQEPKKALPKGVVLGKDVKP